MASFAVDMGDTGSEANRGVATPSYQIFDAASANAVTVGKGLFGVLDDYARSQAKAASTSESAKQQQFRTELLGNLEEATKGVPVDQVRSKVNRIYGAAVTAGLKVDQGVIDAVKVVTGVDVTHAGSDPYLEAENKLLDTLNKSPEWLFVAGNSLASDGVQNPSQEQIQERAFNLIAQSEAATLVSAQAATMGQAQWDATGRANAILAIDNLRDVGVAALNIEIANGNVDPRSLEKLRGEYIKLKALFPKPAYVSDESYQGVKTRLDAIGQMITTIEQYDTNVINNLKQGVIDKVDLAVIKQIEASGETNPLVARALLSNMDKVTEVFANRHFDQLSKIMDGLKPEDLNYESVDFSSLMEQEISEVLDGTTPDGSNPLYILHNLDEVEKAQAHSATDRLNNIDHAMSTMIFALKPEAMNQEDARNLFLQGIDKATVNIATSGTYIDHDMLFNKKTGLFSTHVFDTLKKIDQLDPAAANVARAQLRNALEAASSVQATKTSGTLADTIFRLEGVGQIGFKTEASEMPTAWVDGSVQRFADDYYGGNIFNMLKDKGSKVPRSDRATLRSKGFDIAQVSSKYNEIVAANKENRDFAEAYRKLGGNPAQFEALILDRQEGTTPDVVNRAQNSEQTTEETSTETPEANQPFVISGELSADEQKNAYDNLPSGALFIDPADGKTYRKP